MELTGVIGGLQKHQTIRKDNISPTITQAMGQGGGQIPILVFTQTNGINTPTPSIESTSESVIPEISGQLTLVPSPTLTSSAGDFLAKVSVLLEKEGDLTTPEELSFLKSLGFSRKSNQDCVYWKTSKDCYLMTREELSKPSSPRLMSWGMTSNGKCVTQRITESPRTGNASSLSDILEEHPDQKYFLSPTMTKFMLNDRGKFLPQLLADTTNRDSQTLISLLRNQSQANRVYSKKGISPTVPTASGGRHIPQICESED